MNKILGFITFKLGLNYLLTPFWLFYSILKCISMLAIGMVYVTLCAGVNIILSEFIYNDDATANDYTDAIRATWVASMGVTRKRVCRHPLFWKLAGIYFHLVTMSTYIVNLALTFQSRKISVCQPL